MTISTAWVSTGHLLTQPWIPAEFITNTEALTTRLDQRAMSTRGLDRLASKRRDFRAYGHLENPDEAFNQLWRLRSELVVADRLLGVGVEVTIGRDTPDLECQFADRAFGVEVTTRQPVTIEHTLRTKLGQVGPAGAGCIVYLRRRQPPVFTMSSAALQQAVDRVLAAVVDGHEPVVSLPEAGVTAEIVRGAGFLSQAQVCVVNDMPNGSADYWPTLAQQIISSVQDKASKTYPVDSVLALDVSRLGWCGRWPIDTAWTAAFDDVIDNRCAWGPLAGIVLFRSWLWDRTDPTANPLQVITVCGDMLAMLVANLLSASVAPTL